LFALHMAVSLVGLAAFAALLYMAANYLSLAFALNFPKGRRWREFVRSTQQQCEGEEGGGRMLANLHNCSDIANVRRDEVRRKRKTRLPVLSKAGLDMAPYGHNRDDT
jgi:hypothetical protein